MKSFLSSLRKIDSSTHALRDRIASYRQSQLFTALRFMKSKKRLDKKLEMTSSWASQSRRIARVSLTITLFGKVVLGIFIASTFPASAAPVSVNVCFKTGTELDLNRTVNANTKAKLTNSAYFGSTGSAAPETFNFVSIPSVTSAALTSNSCQIYFGGGSIAGNGTDDLTSAEVTAVSSWLPSAGHFLLAGCDYAGQPSQICSSFRTMTNISNGGVSVNSLLSYNPLACGGALSVSTFGGASSYFTMLAGDTLLAKHNTTAQQPAAITDSLVNPKFLFTGDADMFGSSGASAIGTGATASTDQAKFVVNSFKFGLDAIKGRLGNPQCFASYDQKADLALSISTSNASPVVGGQTTVTVTVVNQSLNNATGVAAIVNLPTGLSLASQTGTGSYSAATQSWSIGSLNGGASATITLTLDVTSAGSLTIPAQISQSSLADIDSSTNVGFGVDDLGDGIADDDEASIVVVVGNSMIDYSDAPDTGIAPNGTGTNAYGTATHIVVAGIKLGAAIDAETASIANATASGDGADDDGISSFPALTAGATSYSIPAANITTTGTGTLHAWIDFNKNGTFESGEHTSVTVTNNILAGALDWAGITTGAAGNTFVRFRFTSDATVTASTPSGIATDGEVEDYQVPISASTVSNPNVLLVKRITKINNQDFTTYLQEDANPYDDNVLEPTLAPNLPTSIPRYPTADTTHWPDTIAKTSSTFLVGKVNGGQVKPNDSIEYTIYFLSAGTSTANNVLLCDRVPDHVTFNPNAFTNTIANPTGVARGIAVRSGDTLDYYTNSGDSDPAQYFPPGIEPSTVYPNISCGKNAAGVILPNDNGAVVVNLHNRPNATGLIVDDIINGTHGFIRFQGRVK
jgi:uncharacterized repeat protein (TIGR01451 family)